MNHYCPQCMAEQNEVDIEDYTCSRCKDGFCVHFMKTAKAPEMIEPPKMDPGGYPRPTVIEPGKWTAGEYICWVCGSDKKKDTVSDGAEV